MISSFPDDTQGMVVSCLKVDLCVSVCVCMSACVYVYNWDMQGVKLLDTVGGAVQEIIKGVVHVCLTAVAHNGHAYTHIHTQAAVCSRTYIIHYAHASRTEVQTPYITYYTIHLHLTCEHNQIATTLQTHAGSARTIHTYTHIEDDHSLKLCPAKHSACVLW
jgi:hypothetical protein